MLLTPPAVLEKYDVPESVLEVLRSSAVRHVSILGRRGPLQAASTNKELRERTSLNGASMRPLAPEFFTHAPDVKLKPTCQQLRLLQILRRQQHGTSTHTWSLNFFRSPMALAPALSDIRASSHSPPSTSILHTDLVIPALGHLRTARGGRVLDGNGRALRRVYASG